MSGDHETHFARIRAMSKRLMRDYPSLMSISVSLMSSTLSKGETDAILDEIGESHARNNPVKFTIRKKPVPPVLEQFEVGESEMIQECEWTEREAVARQKPDGFWVPGESDLVIKRINYTTGEEIISMDRGREISRREAE